MGGGRMREDCGECLNGGPCGSDRCMACIVGVATGPESHIPCCPARNIRMPEQDGQWGPEWDAYDREVERAKRAGG